MKAADFITNTEKEQITEAIREAEKNTSGEIRVHIELKCKGDVLDRAAYLFEKLKMHQTKLRNGVLFYLAVSDRKFAILGDSGINKVTPENFWDEIKDKMTEFFRENQFAPGLVEGIKMAGEALKQHFPYKADDTNELPDDLSFGKE